jgi:3'-phosphoadenosine 5'-phosphosulfate (PAPS) 3'-phosphatase
MDPIDGTKGFISGGEYAIGLGLVQDGKVGMYAHQDSFIEKHIAHKS